MVLIAGSGGRQLGEAVNVRRPRGCLAENRYPMAGISIIDT